MMKRSPKLGKFKRHHGGSGGKPADDVVGRTWSSSSWSPRAKPPSPRLRSLNSDTETATTIQALSNALTEMNTELRSKAVEREALQETVATLAMNLHMSDTHLEQVMTENERLRLKLQAVCFLEKGETANQIDAGEHNDDATAFEPTMLPPTGMRRRQPAKTTGNAQQRPMPHVLNKNTQQSAKSTMNESEHVVKSAHDTERITKQAASVVRTISPDDDEVREPPAVTVDDNIDDRHPSGSYGGVVVDSTGSTAPLSPPHACNSTIQQDAFVRVIRERDEAQKLAKQYKKELFHRRKQVKQLNDELVKTKQLMELTFIDTSDYTDIATGRRKNKKWTTSTDASTPIQWLRIKSGLSPTKAVPKSYRSSYAEDGDEMRDALVSSTEPRSNMYFEPFVPKEIETSPNMRAAF